MTCQQGHEHPFVITGLAMLGVTPPGVGVLKSIEDVAVLYDVAAAAHRGGTRLKIVGGAPMPAGRSKTTEPGAIIARTVLRGAISPSRAEFYAERASRGEDISYLDGLTVALPPGVRRVSASVPTPDDDDAEFASLWPPRTRAEAEQREADRQRIAATAASEMSDDELFAALWPEGEQ